MLSFKQFVLMEEHSKDPHMNSHIEHSNSLYKGLSGSSGERKSYNDRGRVIETSFNTSKPYDVIHKHLESNKFKRTGHDPESNMHSYEKKTKDSDGNKTKHSIFIQKKNNDYHVSHETRAI